MLAVKPIRYVAFSVKLIKDPIGIVLHSCRENDNFEVLRHLFEECLGTRSDQELTIEVPTSAVAWVFVGL
jgi:hypothetical protein